MFLSGHLKSQTVENDEINAKNNPATSHVKTAEQLPENSTTTMFITGDAKVFINKNTEISGKIVYIKPRAKVKKMAEKPLENKPVLVKKKEEEKSFKQFDTKSHNTKINFTGDSSTRFSIANSVSIKAVHAQQNELKLKKNSPHFVEFLFHDFGEIGFFNMATNTLKYFQYYHKNVSRAPPFFS